MSVMGLTMEDRMEKARWLLRVATGLHLTYAAQYYDVSARGAVLDQVALTQIEQEPVWSTPSAMPEDIITALNQQATGTPAKPLKYSLIGKPQISNSKVSRRLGRSSSFRSRWRRPGARRRLARSQASTTSTRIR